MKRAYLAVAVATILLAACASSPSPSYYSLDLRTAHSASSKNTPSVSVGLIGIPEALDRPQMVSRDGYVVHVSDRNRWAEPLRRAIPRTVASEMGTLLNSSQVFSGSGLQTADFRVLLDVQRFDVVTAGSVEIDILWRMEGKGNTHSGRSTVQEPIAGRSVEAQVEAQRRGLTRVAAQIAQAISEASSAK